MASTDIQFAFHSQYSTDFLRTPASDSAVCIVDWTAAQEVAKLAHAINGDPYRSWASLQRLPYAGKGLQMSVNPDTSKIELAFPPPTNHSETIVFQLARQLMYAKSAIYLYAGLDKNPHGGTQTQALRFGHLVADVEIKVNRGNRWQGVSQDASLGMSILKSMDRASDVKDYSDPYIMKTAQDALTKIKTGIDATMAGFSEVRFDIEEADRNINTLSTSLKSSCLQISSLINGLSDAEQRMLTVLDALTVAAEPTGTFGIALWALRVKKVWDTANLHQLDTWEKGWAKISSNCTIIDTTGKDLQQKLDAAVQACKDRLASPGEPTDTDGLHSFMTLFSRIKSKLEAWFQAVDEMLIINWQYMVGLNGVQNPMEKLFTADIEFVLEFPL